MALKTKEDFKYAGLIMLFSLIYISSIPVGGMIGLYFDQEFGNNRIPMFGFIGVGIGIVVEILSFKLAKRIN